MTTASLEQFANVAQTTLNGNILAGATSLTLASATGFPTVGNFRLLIDNEIFICTAISGTTCTVIPGAEGTTQANHTSGVNVTLGITKGSLLAGFQLGPIEPAGRLTLVSNTPVMTANTTAQSTIYYCAYDGDWYSLWNGTSWQAYPLDTQLSMALDSNAAHTGYQQSGNLFDVFVTLNAGVPVLCTGPAWTNKTTRSAALALLNGIQTNAAAMTAKIDSTATTISIPANQATWIGPLYATANGQTGFNPWPAAAAGGGAPYVAIANGYNQVPVTCRCLDSTTSYTYATNTWRMADNNANNSISFIDPLGTTSVLAVCKNAAANATATDFFEIGMNLNSQSATPVNIGYSVSGTTTLADDYKTVTVVDEFGPALGYNYIQHMENNSAVTTTYNPVSGVSSLIATVYY
jgi:hypothetical protein